MRLRISSRGGRSPHANFALDSVGQVNFPCDLTERHLVWMWLHALLHYVTGPLLYFYSQNNLVLLVPVWNNCLLVVFRSKDGWYAFSLSSIFSIGADTTSVISQLLFLPNIMWIQLQLADERKEYLPSPAPLLLPILHSFCNVSHGRRPDKLFMLNCVVWTVLQFLANSLIGETGRELGLVLLEYLLNACIY